MPGEIIPLNYESPPPPRAATRVRFIVWVALVAWQLIGLAFVVTSESFIAGWVGLSTGVLVLSVLLVTTPADAIRLTPSISSAVIFVGLLLPTALTLVRFNPALSNDMLRYRQDARMWSADISPWETSPNDWLRSPASLSGSGVERGWDLATPFPELRSIYPPVAQVFFVTARGVAEHFSAALARWTQKNRAPAQLTFYRVRAWIAVGLRAGAALFVATAVVLLIGGTLRVGSSPWYAALFAFQPLTVIETAGQGHVDALGVMFLVAAVVAALRDRFVFAAVLLALAAGVKPQAAIAAPALIVAAYWRGKALVSETALTAKASHASASHESALRKERLLQNVANSPALVCRALSPEGASRRGADFLRFGAPCALAFLISLVLIYSPLLFNAGNFRGWYETVQVYSMAWEANGSIYELITAPFRHGDGRSLESAKMAARVIGGVGAFVTLYTVIRNRLPLADSVYWLMLVPLLLAPVVYPWYLLWPLAMVPLLSRSRGWTALVWAATSGLSYQLLNEPTWRLPTPWLMAEYLPVYAALAWELWSLRTCGQARKRSTGASPVPAQMVKA